MGLINRHNYEQYFLLWVDGELSPEEMEAVERFVASNPDLADELAILQDTKLVPDNAIVFENKAQLLKVHTNEINLNNYETWFLLYVDQELTLADQQKVELFVLQHPSLQAEFELFQQTKLAKEEWIFTHKDSLYKTEKAERPVVYMRWMRYAVAAVFIGIVATVWMIAPEKTINQSLNIPSVQPEVVGNQPEINEPESNKTEINQPESNSVISTAVAPSATKGSANNASKTVAAANGPKPTNASLQTTINETTKATAQSLTKSNAVSNNRKEAGLPTIVTTEPVEKDRQLIARLENDPIPTTKIELPSQRAIIGQNTIDQDQGSKIEPAEEVKTVYTALEDDDDNKSLYIGALEINKDKLRGIFRKAGTIFRSKSKQEDDTRQRK